MIVQWSVRPGMLVLSLTTWPLGLHMNSILDIRIDMSICSHIVLRVFDAYCLHTHTHTHHTHPLIHTHWVSETESGLPRPARHVRFSKNLSRIGHHVVLCCVIMMA